VHAEIISVAHMHF